MINFLLIIIYPVAAHLSILLHKPSIGLLSLALIGLSQLKLSFYKQHPYYAGLIIACATALLLAAIVYKITLLFYFPPLLITAGLLLLFAQSLLPKHQALISSFVCKTFNNYQYDVMRYTRRVTIAWVLFFSALLIEIILLSLFAHKTTWSLFCNILNYFFIGLFFIGESVCRHYYFGGLVSNTYLIKSLISTPLKQFSKQDQDKSTLLALLGHSDLKQIFAIHKNKEINCDDFLYDVNLIASTLNNKKYIINLCQDRYYFCVTFAAALIKGKTVLLPANESPESLMQLCQNYPESDCIRDQNCKTLSQPRDNINFRSQHIPNINTQHIAVITFTSGTTGKAQAWPKKWGELIVNIKATQKALKLCRKKIYRFIATVPSQHMYGIEHAILMPMQSGNIIQADKPFFPGDIHAAIADFQTPCILVSTPLHLRSCTASQQKTPTLSKIICSTDTLSQPLATQIEMHFHTPLIEIYGCTEAGAIATRRTTQTDTWQLMHNAKLIKKEDHFYLYRKEELNLKNIVALQDSFRIINSTQFIFIGRGTDQINIAGKRINLQELNEKLTSINGIKAGIFLMPKEKAGETTRLAAFVVAPNIDKQSINKALSHKIPSAFLPRTIVHLKKLPYNSMGKINRQELLQLINTKRTNDEPPANILYP